MFDMFDAYNHLNHQKGSDILSNVTIDLVVGKSDSLETVVLDDLDDLRGISYEENRTEGGTSRDTGSDCHCPGSSAVEPDELSAAREAGFNPLVMPYSFLSL